MRRTQELTISIERLTHEGRGLGHAGGKAVFVAGALPGEQVRARRWRRRSRYDEALTVEVLERAAARVEPPCRYTRICGGCSLQHLGVADQLAHKQAVLRDLLLHQAKVEPREWLAPLTGPSEGYRRRARLAVRYVAGKGGALVGFREKAGGFVADIESCKVLEPVIGERIADLRALVNRLSIRARLAQIEVAIGDARTALVFRHLAALSAEDRAHLEGFGREHGIDIWLQSGGIETLAPLVADTPFPSYKVEGVDIAFAPTDFTQINPVINARMVRRAIELLDLEASDQVLDLFCGVGNFSLPMARHAGRVTGVEGDSQLVARARANAERNAVRNVEFLVADLDRPLARWPRQARKVLLDPPRSGAAELIAESDLSSIERLVYVSCNPITLARDAQALVGRHRFALAAAGVMDMFPHTAHVESMAVFRRN